MVDVSKLKARMVLMGYNQRSIVAEMNARGHKTTENTFSSKLKNPRKFNCADADVICNILKIRDFAERAEIFLA